MRTATCHPEKQHYSKGYCAPCYRKQLPRTKNSVMATCHPDRPHRSRGLCNACYLRLRDGDAFQVIGRIPKSNECAHPERKHYSNGRCKQCFTIWWRLTNPETDHKHRFTTRLNRYGLSEQRFREILHSQNSCCALCEKPLLARKQMNIDHCHETGVVRGILCFTCNKALGMLGDSEAAIQRALDYIRAAAPHSKERAA